MENARGKKLVIIAGDINAKSVQSGSPRNDARGRYWEEWLSEMDMTAVNTGEPTFVRGNSQSHIDVTIGTRAAVKKIHNWRILDEDIFTYHKYIYYELYTTKKTKYGRTIKEINTVVLEQEMNNIRQDECSSLDDIVKQLQTATQKAET